MSEEEKKRQRIYDIKPKKTFRNNYSFLWPPSSPDHNPLDFTIWSILENKTNATSIRDIGSLKTAIDEEKNKMSEEFILKAYKSFQRRVDSIIEKKKRWPYWVNLLFFIYLFILLFILETKMNLIL